MKDNQKYVVQALTEKTRMLLDDPKFQHLGLEQVVAEATRVLREDPRIAGMIGESDSVEEILANVTHSILNNPSFANVRNDTISVEEALLAEARALLSEPTFLNWFDNIVEAVNNKDWQHLENIASIDGLINSGLILPPETNLSIEIIGDIPQNDPPYVIGMPVPPGFEPPEPPKEPEFDPSWISTPVPPGFEPPEPPKEPEFDPSWISTPVPPGFEPPEPPKEPEFDPSWVSTPVPPGFEPPEPPKEPEFDPSWISEGTGEIKHIEEPINLTIEKDNVKVGVVLIPTVEDVKVEEKGDATIVTKEPARLGIGITITF